ncbi:hypothetical protein D5H75_09885 [Bailinhaonella thermotolerans]|uniref:Uncharacterized protein n=1 Tax=Bailinhaonella thermotolerans TaxID=1070861 RepID=A0A3A4B503_9ACTN|nr:hypothetical protein D5H75_09885 [Bailinhaonella thermotolerans]
MLCLPARFARQPRRLKSGDHTRSFPERSFLALRKRSSLITGAPRHPPRGPTRPPRPRPCPPRPHPFARPVTAAPRGPAWPRLPALTAPFPGVVAGAPREVRLGPSRGLSSLAGRPSVWARDVLGEGQRDVLGGGQRDVLGGGQGVYQVAKVVRSGKVRSAP